MAGNQASAMSITADDTQDLYIQPPRDTPPSTVYFNKVKSWMKHNMMKEVAKWEEVYGEKDFWKLVYNEMTEYTFGFEANQATFIYIKYKDKLL